MALPRVLSLADPLLRRAEARSRELPDAARDAARRELRLAAQKDTATERLWLGGCPAEALPFARDALAAALRAAVRLGGTATDAPADVPVGGADPSDADVSAALRKLGLDAEDIAAVLAAREATRTAALPAYDSDVTEAHAETQAAARTAYALLADACARDARSTREIQWMRRLRVGGLAMLGVALVTAALWSALHTSVAVVASGYNLADSGRPPENAFDGDVATAWVLPDNTPGWIEARFPRARRIRAVQLTNTHNGLANNAATHDYRIEAYAGDRLLATHRGSFPRLDPNVQPVLVPFAASGVTRVRVVVESYHGVAGGLNEIVFE